MLGRHEIQVEWNPPKDPLSRINSYEVKVNGEVWLCWRLYHRIGHCCFTGESSSIFTCRSVCSNSTSRTQRISIFLVAIEYVRFKYVKYPILYHWYRKIITITNVKGNSTYLYSIGQKQRESRRTCFIVHVQVIVQAQP